ncbi:MAG: hypothetical protein F6K36_22775 [Symploca sp. SIO3C6]|nr:hypothetical protein [Symploca sp. SIO3C6]
MSATKKKIKTPLIKGTEKKILSENGNDPGLTEPLTEQEEPLTEQEEPLTESPKALTEPLTVEKAIPLAEVCSQLEITRPTIYRRLRILHQLDNSIESELIKINNKSHLNLCQFEALEKITTYYNSHNTFEGFELEKLEEEAESTTASEDGTITVVEQQQLSTGETPPPAEEIPLAASSPHFSEQELETIDQQAQIIGAVKHVATQELADYYANTGYFTNPQVIEMVKERRTQSQQQWTAAHEAVNPNALSQLLRKRAKTKAAAGQNL